MLEELKRENILPVFVSGSACDFLCELAKFLGAYDVLATKLEINPDGIYTGKITGQCMIGEGKAKAVSDFLKKNRAEPSSCYGVGDHESDINFISLLGHGVMISGQENSEKVAKEMNWKII